LNDFTHLPADYTLGSPASGTVREKEEEWEEGRKERREKGVGSAIA